MKCRSGDVIVLATSGLGNQLFQLAASLYLNGGDSASLIALGNERQHVPGFADIAGFKLSDMVNLAQPTVGSRVKIARKLLGEAQAMAARNNGDSDLTRESLANLSPILAPLLLRPELRCKRRIRVAKGIGYDPTVASQQPDEFWLGYFQSWRYSKAELVADFLGGPAPAISCSWFETMEARASIERPLIVHVRLGDYRHIPGVGIPDHAYYRRALLQATASVSPRAIWLFSDEPEEARALLPRELGDLEVEPVVPPINCSHPATVLSVMSRGSGFVTANSTFSYWAARLSGVTGDKIFVPHPWFPVGPEIRDMIPEDWTRVPRAN